MLQLTELGFPAAACRLALETNGCNSARAAEWLFDEGGDGRWVVEVRWVVEIKMGSIFFWGKSETTTKKMGLA